MNTKISPLCLIALLWLSTSTNLRAQSIYYVDADQGSDSNGGLSRSEAFASINQAASVTQPGDTVTILPGTYRGTNPKNPWDEILISRSGSVDNYITYRGETDSEGNRPRVISVSVSGISVVGAAYIVVEGLELIPGDEDTKGVIDRPKLGIFEWQRRRGVSVANGSHHVIVRDMYVHDFPGHGISTVRSDVLLFENNLVEHCAYRSNNANSGITLFQPTRIDVAGFPEYPDYRIICRGNTSRYNVNLRGFADRPENALVDGHGIILDVFRTGKNSAGETVPYTGRTLVTENVCYGNGGYGINVYRSDRADVYNNTLFDNAHSTRIANPGYFVFILDAQLQVGDADDVNVVNNILANSNASPTTYNSFRITNVNFRNNIHWNQSGNITTASDDDIVADPQFVKATALTPAQTRLLATPTNPFNPNSASAQLRTPTQNNGFPVQDLRVRAGSPAVDAGVETGVRTPQGESIDVGAFEYESATDPTPDPDTGEGAITIRARGDCGSETMELRIDGTTVQTWSDVSTSFTDYTYEGFSGEGEISVHFTNDLSGFFICDRNLTVDYIQVCGTVYQTEEDATETAECCFFDPQKLYTNGNFNFGTLPCGSNARRSATADKTSVGSTKLIPGWQVYPNPAEEQVTVVGPLQYELTLYDLRGNLVQQVSDLSGQSHLSVATVKPGVYVLNLRDGQTQQTYRQRLVVTE